MKSKFRRSMVSSASDMCDCIESSTPVSKLNRAHLVGNEAGVVHVPTYDWQEMFQGMKFKLIPQIREMHDFTFTLQSLKVWLHVKCMILQMR